MSKSRAQKAAEENAVLAEWRDRSERISNAFLTYGGLKDHRAVAIVSATLVEECLSRFLRSRLRDCDDLFKVNAPLGTHSARYRVAYAMRLIDARAKSDMEGIAKIRNKFAHLIDDDLTFEDKRFGKIFANFLCEKHRKDESLKDFYRRVCESTAVELWVDERVQRLLPGGGIEERATGAVFDDVAVTTDAFASSAEAGARGSPAVDGLAA